MFCLEIETISEHFNTMSDNENKKRTNESTFSTPTTDQKYTVKANETNNKDNDNVEKQLSEEDQKLKDDLEMLVETLKENNNETQIYFDSLNQLKMFIKNSTNSMTAVPKPLKFLRPNYHLLCQIYDKWVDPNLKSSLADILSVLAMTYFDNGKYDSLKFRLLSNNFDDIQNWGHEYIRHLALEIGEVYQIQLESTVNNNNNNNNDNSNKDDITINTTTPDNKSQFIANQFSKDDIVQLSLNIVPYFLKHNGEEDAVDLLLEIESIDKLPQFVDNDTYKRVCQYMVACVPLLPSPDNTSFLKTAYTIYLNHSEWTNALSLAIRLNDTTLIKSIFDLTNDPIMLKQLAYILSTQRITIQLDGNNDSDNSLKEIIGNTKLSELFLYLVKELNLLEPKVPEDIYKSHLDNSKSLFNNSGLDSAQQNLAASFVNSFLNMGYCKDKMIVDNDNWVYKTKGDGMTSAVASIGSIFQWNLDGLQQLDKYLYVEETEIKAGALLGIGVSATGIHDGDVEPALLLLQDYVTNSNQKISFSAILGLGIAFAGSQNEEVLSILLPLASDTSLPTETATIACLALSHVFVGTCNGDITTSILDNFLERNVMELNTEWIRFLALSLGLLYLGQGEQVDDVMETLSAIEHPMTAAIEVLINSCAFCGSGDVLLIQELLHRLTPKVMTKQGEEEDDDEEDYDDENNSAAANGLEAFLSQQNDASNKDSQNEDNDNMNIDAPEEDNNNNNTQENDHKTPELSANASSSEEHVKKETDTSNDEDKSKEKDAESSKIDELAFAVLGIALIAIGEDIGKEMSLRHFGHLMHYGNEHIRRMVPLAMGLVSIADPQMKVFDALTRYSHDTDLDVSMNSILAMGLCGVGTNNARLAQLLRQIASYYSREQDVLFITRLAQGLLHLGKGTLTMDIFNDAHVLNKVTLASLLTVLVGMVSPSFMLVHHQLFYMLNSGVRPKFIITLNEEGEPIKVNVRVGQAVETVGQAGKPKTITGWITQSTPVLLGHGERAELENDEYISYTSNLEGVVILKKNPDFNKEDL